MRGRSAHSCLHTIWLLLPHSGILLIAEVRSRFEESGIDVFISAVSEVGFHLRRKDLKNQMFATLEFQKNRGTPSTPNKEKEAAKGTQTQQKQQQQGGKPAMKSQPHQGGKSSGHQKLSHKSSSDKKSGLTAKQSSTHPVQAKKNERQGDAPMLTACIYKKR